MSDWQQVQRERETETRVRSLDAADIVTWIHRLEDRISELEDEVEDLGYEICEANSRD